MSEIATRSSSPLILSRPEHPVSRAAVSDNALKVLYRLHRSGFVAYLVGGAVRDLMLGRTPKDFDIGTNARPQQVRRLFNNARLIGRRFRLARIVFPEEVVEVATFRRSPEPPEAEEAETVEPLAPAMEAEEYGTPEEDAFRRDFTVNGLFYNIGDYSVIDWVGGLADLRDGVIRSIGPARTRFLEDPVRMMRAVEYSARLGFRIADETQEAITEMPGDIRRTSPARIAYELLESLKVGQACGIFRGLEEYGLLAPILPETHAALAADGDGLLWRLLARVDATLKAGGALREETLLAVLFLPGFLQRLDGRTNLRPGELETLIREYLDPAAVRLALSNFRGHVLRAGFLLLSRLAVRPASTKLVLRTLRQDAFPVAWELAHLLEGVYGPAENLELWRQARTRADRGVAPVEAPVADPASRRRRRRRPRRSPGRPAGGAS